MIRFDVESIDTDDLTREFKAENCVSAGMHSKYQRRGNGLHHETKLNSVLRGKLGLISRLSMAGEVLASTIAFVAGESAAWRN